MFYLSFGAIFAEDGEHNSFFCGCVVLIINGVGIGKGICSSMYRIVIGIQFVEVSIDTIFGMLDY